MPEASGRQLTQLARRRVVPCECVGSCPSPENLHERLIAALAEAGDDASNPVEGRSKFQQAATWLGSLVSQVAIGALGGAGGKISSGKPGVFGTCPGPNLSR